MKPTPTQIEAAARAMCEADGVDPDGDLWEMDSGRIINPAWIDYEAKAIAGLSAALSVQPAAAVVGEPVAWIAQSRWEQMTAAEPWLTNVVYSEDQAASFPCVPLYAAPSAPEGWQPDAGQQWRLDRIGEEIAAGRKQNALTYLSCVFAEISQRQKAIDKVLAAEADFRSNMPADWQGDPLSDAVAELRKALGGKP